MNTAIIKQNPHGGFDIAASSNAPVRILLVEDDTTDSANIEINGEAYIGLGVTTEIQPKLVADALSTFNNGFQSYGASTQSLARTLLRHIQNNVINRDVFIKPGSDNNDDRARVNIALCTLNNVIEFLEDLSSGKAS